jgi:hypothetical protein
MDGAGVRRLFNLSQSHENYRSFVSHALVDEPGRDGEASKRKGERVTWKLGKKERGRGFTSTLLYHDLAGHERMDRTNVIVRSSLGEGVRERLA